MLYHTPTKSRALTQQVTKVKRGPIPAGGSDLWEEEKLVIPPVPPSFLNGCSIIDIKYTLEVIQLFSFVVVVVVVLFCFQVFSFRKK